MHVELEHLSISEIREQIENLSETDIFRLGVIGGQFAWRCSMDGSDLLNEAIARSLSGHRKCPRDIKFITFLVNTMKSIAFDEKRKTDLIPIQEPVDNDPANDPLLSATGNNKMPLESVELENEIDALYALFSGDEGVTMLLMGLQDGCSPNEICKMEGWDKKKYDAARKRLRRGVINNFPDGRQT